MRLLYLPSAFRAGAAGTYFAIRHWTFDIQYFS
jgi:hypothetical protein